MPTSRPPRPRAARQKPGERPGRKPSRLPWSKSPSPASSEAPTVALEQPKLSEQPVASDSEPESARPFGSLRDTKPLNVPTAGPDRALLERLAAQQKARYKAFQKRAIYVAVAVVAVVAVAAVVFFSPLFAFQKGSCVVRGNQEVSAAQICAAFDDWDGHQLTRMSMSSAQRHLLDSVSPIASARIRRDLLHGLSIEVSERIPVVAGRWNGKLVGLDLDAVPLERTAEQLSNLPQLDMEIEKLGGLGGKAVTTALQVLGQMDKSLAAKVKNLTVKNGQDLVLKLDSGIEVYWADASESALKSEVTTLLLGQKGIKHIDVSNPQRPSTY